MSHKLRRSVRLLAALCVWLSLQGCDEKEAQFFAPILGEATAGSITGIVVSDDGSPLGDVMVSLSGDASGTTTTASDGSYAFGGLSAGTFNVSIQAPAAHDCPVTSQSTTLTAGASQALDFTCDRIVPTASEIAGDWVFTYINVGSTCGPLIDPFDALAMITAEDNTLSVTFSDAPPGGSIVGPYNPNTGQFDGETPEVDLGGGISAVETWSSTFNREVLNGDAETGMPEGDSHVEFSFPGNDCTVDYEISGVQNG